MTIIIDDYLEHPVDYDGDGDLRWEVVVLRLAEMLGKIPNASASKAMVYHYMMIQHVMAIPGLSRAALEIGCRTVEREWKEDHAPPIAVVIKAIEEVLPRELVNRWRKRNGLPEGDD